MDILFVASVSLVVLILIYTLIRRDRSGISVVREPVLRKRESSATTTHSEYHVNLTEWHTLLIESGYVGSVIYMHMRAGDSVSHFTDDPDVPNKYPLKIPFVAEEKGTLLIYVNDLETGDVDYEWRRLRV